MERMIEHHHGRSTGRRAGVFDRVLERLAAGVEQRGPLLVVAWSEPVQGLADLEVALIGVREKTGMGEFRQLPSGAVDNTRRAVADAGDRDATPEIDERVSVDIDQYPITRRGRINARGTCQAGGHGSAATNGQFGRPRPRDRRDHPPYLWQARCADRHFYGRH